MTSDNAAPMTPDLPESTSDNTRPRRPGARPVPLTSHLEAVHAEYMAALRRAPVDDDTRRTYGSRVRQYLAWLDGTEVDRDPLADPTGRDWALRDYRAHLQSVVKRKPLDHKHFARRPRRLLPPTWTRPSRCASP
jgi:integrase/recombinase XerC